jgi:biopolymer transport protein ExbD
MVSGNAIRELFPPPAVYTGTGMSAGGNHGIKAEINITPMIDVLLVLIIMFMVIVPLKPVGLPSQVPQPSPRSPHSPPGPRHGVVFIDAEPALEFAEVARVIDIARGAGVSNTGLMPGKSAC